jgi:unsaturated rhamnogalacturonyl hydrolase
MAKESNKPWSERIAKSFLTMHPDSISYPTELKSKRWNYEQGVIMEALFHEWQLTGDSTYVRYIKKNLDDYIGEDGTRIDSMNINWITSHPAKLCSGCIR